MFIEDERERYIVARWCYLMGQSSISDIEYDELDKKFKRENPNDPYSLRPWSFDECPVDLLVKYGLQDLIAETKMGYMAESIYSINNWDEYTNTFRGLSEKTRVSFKIDGWNIRVSYFNGHIVGVQTRGRSGNNLDVNGIYTLFPKEIPISGKVAVTGELSIPNDKWNSYKELTGNVDQRASVRTALASNDVEYLSFLAFNIFIEGSTDIGDSYDKLKELGFETPRFKYVNNFAELQDALKYFSYINRGYNYLTDGIVVENSSLQNAVRLGAWEEHDMESYVTGYEEDQGMYGTYIKVKIKPVQIEGKTWSRVSIGNISNIIENNLKPDSPIAFNFRSSANVVLNVSKTRELQNQWAGNYEGYKNMVNRRSS